MKEKKLRQQTQEVHSRMWKNADQLTKEEGKNRLKQVRREDE